MPRLKVNLAGVEVGGVNVPPGRYLSELVDVQEGESKTGNPMLIWEWEISEGDYSGNTIRSWTSLQEQALFGLKGHLIGLGEDEEDVDMELDELIGRRVYLTIQTRKWKDQDSGEDREGSSVAKVEEYRKPRRTSGKKRRPKDDDEDDDQPPF